MNTSKLYRLSIKNYRSFYGKQVIDFRSGESVRCVSSIYGPNASGKTNIAKALNFMRFFIVNSTAANITEIPCEPFLLKKDSSLKPSEFEIEFTQDKRHFIYGFSVTKHSVQREYLREFASTTKKARTIFDRKENGLNPTSERYSFGKKLFESTLPSSLLITKARENNNEYANILFNLVTSINILFGEPTETMQWSVDQLRAKPALNNSVLNLLKNADLWIRAFNVENVQLPREFIHQLPVNEKLKNELLTSNSQPFSVKTVHAVRDKNQKIIGEQIFDLNVHESSGTQKFFELAAPIIDTLENGKILYIDEFGSQLHSDMCRFIVSLFKSSKNKNKAQLIINTHDTALMGQDGPLEREDILFVEKNYAEESVVKALSDKSARNDEAFEKRYRKGLYGAKPQIDFME